MPNDKRNKSLTVFFQVALLSILSHLSTSTAADSITIVADEWAPYNGEPNSSEPGYGIEIAERIFEAAGHQIIYKIVPWNRAIKDTRKGEYNAIIGALEDDAPDFVFPAEEFGVSVNAFFVKKGTQWEFIGTESLKTVKAGLIKDYSYGEELDAFFKANKNVAKYVHGGDPLSSNIKKLLAGRVDVLIEDANVLQQKAKSMGVDDQIVKAKSKKGAEDSRIYIAFSPKHAKSQEYAELLTKGIRKMQASGELEKILEKYGLTYWK